MRRKDGYICVFLAILPVLMILFLTKGDIFGSRIDWINQHVMLPEYFRKMVWQNHTIFFDYFPHLQAGSNAYDFSYYGFFRPDILLSIVLPNIGMAAIISTYMIVLMSLGCLSCYYWLREKGYSRQTVFFVSCLYLCTTSIFFQSHRQIMFVNYLPFLFLALHAIDKEQWKRLTVYLFLIVIHSYFYAIAAYMICFATICIEKKKFKIYLFLLSLGWASVLLLPTFLVILENRHSVTGMSWIHLIVPNVQLKGLLYYPYGCGFTLLAWASILLGIQNPHIRKYALVLILAFVFPLVPYLLNGTLYARAKILITLIPWVLYVIADSIDTSQEKKINLYGLGLFVLPIVFQKRFLYAAVMDGCMVMLLFWMVQRKKQAVFMGLILPCYMVLSLNGPQTFIKQTYFQQIESINMRTGTGRTACYIHNFQTANKVDSMNIYRISSYTSTGNSKYNHYLYDVMKNPISAANRVANLDNSNIFIQGMLNVKNIVTNKKVPVGYRLMKQKRRMKYYRNTDVMPLAYTTDLTMTQKTFEQLPYPYNLDTIYNRVIVPKGKTVPYKSKIHKIKSSWIQPISRKNIQIQKGSKGYVVHAKKKSRVVFKKSCLKNKQILFIDFKVKPKNKKSKTKISINGIRNCLSSESSYYNNHNKRFTYIVSSQNFDGSLRCSFSKGNYTLSDFHMYTLSYHILKKHSQEVQVVKLHKPSTDEVLHGTAHVQTNGYFVTSLAYQNGFQCYVDGKKVKPEVVNTSFLGFPIKKGKHTVSIVYHAPGKQLGIWIGLVSLYIYFRKKSGYEKN